MIKSLEFSLLLISRFLINNILYCYTTN